MRRALVPLAALLLTPAIAFGATERRLTADPTATDVAAYGGKVVWSRGESAGIVFRYRLVEQTPAGPRDLPVEPSPVPFELDVGPDEDGDPAAVYVRCIPDVQCDVYRYDFERRAETRVEGISAPRCSASDPSIWRGDIAFVRESFFTANCVDGLYVREASGKVRRLLRSGPGIKRLVYLPDLRGGSVAFGADRQRSANTELYLMRVRDRRIRLIAKAAGEIFTYPIGQPVPPDAPRGRGYSVGVPTLGRRNVYWVRHHIPRSAYWLGTAPRRQLRKRQYATLPQSGQPAGNLIYFEDGKGILERSLPRFGRR